MTAPNYTWTRFWAPRESSMHLDPAGYLYDPETGDGEIFNKLLVPLARLTHQPCLILLGEPGSGKTRALDDEIPRESTRVTAAGGVVLRVDLHEIATVGELDEAVFHQPAWKDTSTPLHLFLDSMEESPLGVDVIAARLLKRFDTRPRDSLAVRVVCRTAEWPSVLEAGLRARWPDVGVFEIAPLRRIDVETAARTHGLDPTRTLTAFAESEAQPFALRPVTLRFLLTSLAEGKSLPHSKIDLYSRLCRSLCEEPSDGRTRAGVQPEARVVLAERIAASLLLGARTAVVTGPDRGDLAPGDLPIHELVGGREVIEGELFADGTDSDLREAMRTGLFSARGPERLAFAHHSFAEFLAARYLRRHRLSAPQIRNLVTHPRLGRVVPALHGTVAWLASMDDAFFDFVADRDPHVLLGADLSTLSAAQKGQLARNILDPYDKGEHLDHDVASRQDLRKLAHVGIDALLRPYVRGKDHEVSARRVAIRIAESCTTTSLCADLVAVIFDRDDHLAVRSVAAHAVVAMGNATERQSLRPLAVATDESDTNDDLKGYALQAIWPDEVTVSDLLALMTPARDAHYFGAYQAFTRFHLAAGATDADWLVLLQWTESQGPRQVLGEPARGLLDEVLEKTWERLMQPAFPEAYSRAVLARMRHHDLPVVTRALHEEAWSTDVVRRRAVLRCALAQAPDTPQVHHEYWRLLAEGDVRWHIDLLGEALEREARAFLVGFLRDATLSLPVDDLDALITAAAHHPDLAEALRPHFDAVAIDGPVADELRAQQARFAELFADRRPKPTLPPVGERVTPLLDRFERGEVDAYWQIDPQLGADEYGNQHLTALQKDVTQLPGWKALDESTRGRIITAACRYVTVGRCSRDEWVGTDHHWNPALAGYRALWLSVPQAPDGLDSVSADAWKEWAPIIAAFPGIEQSGERDRAFLARAYLHAPETTLDALLAVCRDQDARFGCIFGHQRLDELWDDRIAAALQTFSKAALKIASLRSVLDLLLAHGVPETIAFATSLVSIPVPADAAPRGRMLTACACLMRHALADTWPLLQKVFAADPTFGREVVGDVASGVDVRRRPIAAKLAESDCMALVLWLEDQFPVKEDPDIRGGHAVGIREQVGELRRSILEELVARGTPAALDALRAAERMHPSITYLRRAVLVAEHHTLARTWTPVTPAQLRALAANATRRLVADDDDLLDVVVESLERLAAKLTGRSLLVRFLWDKQLDGSFVPVDENTLSDFVREHLETDIAKSGIVLNREVQLRPSIARKTGERTDIHVDAVSRDVAGKGFGRITVIIETKCNWNGELDSAMETQLRDRYLTGTGVQRGIYLVGWYASALWSPRDGRRGKTPKKARRNVMSRLGKQATRLSSDVRRIVTSCLDATLPGAPKGVKTPSPSKVSKKATVSKKPGLSKLSKKRGPSVLAKTPGRSKVAKKRSAPKVRIAN